MRNAHAQNIILLTDYLALFGDKYSQTVNKGEEKDQGPVVRSLFSLNGG